MDGLPSSDALWRVFSPLTTHSPSPQTPTNSTDRDIAGCASWPGSLRVMRGRRCGGGRGGGGGRAGGADFPLADDGGRAAGDEEGPGHSDEAVAAADFAAAGLAARQDDEVGREVEVHDLARFEESVFCRLFAGREEEVRRQWARVVEFRVGGGMDTAMT